MCGRTPHRRMASIELRLHLLPLDADPDRCRVARVYRRRPLANGAARWERPATLPRIPSLRIASGYFSTSRGQPKAREVRGTSLRHRGETASTPATTVSVELPNRHL